MIAQFLFCHLKRLIHEKLVVCSQTHVVSLGIPDARQSVPVVQIDAVDLLSDTLEEQEEEENHCVIGCAAAAAVEQNPSTATRRSVMEPDEIGPLGTGCKRTLVSDAVFGYSVEESVGPHVYLATEEVRCDLVTVTDLPLHTFTWLVGSSWNLIKGFVQRKIVSDGVLPACLGESVEGIMTSDPVINLTEGENAFFVGQDGLCDHRSNVGRARMVLAEYLEPFQAVNVVVFTVAKVTIVVLFLLLHVLNGVNTSDRASLERSWDLRSHQGQDFRSDHRRSISCHCLAPTWNLNTVNLGTVSPADQELPKPGVQVVRYVGVQTTDNLSWPKVYVNLFLFILLICVSTNTNG
ncbi:hypothetical protein WICPIJ_001983 [Wickerhamomyces pijperi]|uniref:Uncharacterized protein n=1 Tax=Wickerhamomyces pijperi TaxID=599730 RepID=A0A9P8QCR5_WICPI|nr:hypothetical protein WICPIJ_001983 [Wickerhamomyces pijperi]